MGQIEIGQRFRNIPGSRSTARASISVNGRWLSKPLTGTGRYAEEVCKTLVSMGTPIILWVPKDANLPEWTGGVHVRRLRTKGQIFEQIALPLWTRGGVLLSMAGPAAILKRRQVAVLHDAAPFRIPHTYSRAFALWYRLMYKALVKRGAQIATVSDFSARELSAVLKLEATTVTLAPPAATIANRAVKPRTAEIPEVFFLTVGTLASHKNLGPVVSALADAGLHVVCAGTAGSAQVFATIGLKEAERITALGRVTDEELLWLYENAQALVFPSLYEGFGLPPIEAQKAGCVVIASTAGPLPEVLSSSALFADPHDPASFLERAKEVSNCPGLRAELQKKGHENTERFNWSETASRLVTALDGVRRVA